MARYQFSDHAELRAVSHIDMDCFYVQVEQRRNPELKGKPTAVVQYNPWKGGGLIAVGYEARARGVKKQMRGDDAREHCPDINLVTVPTAHGKADLTIYREAGAEVVSILSRKGRCERASIDEVYLDLTEAAKERMAHVPTNRDDLHAEAQKSHVLGVTPNVSDASSWLVSRTEYSEQLLAAAALIVAELREAVRMEARFSCSAGVAHNKMLAKLASNMHKPAQQTLVPLAAVPGLFEELPLKKLRQLGGKLGASLENQLGLNTAGDLMRVPLERLQDMHGKNVGMWLFRISRGLDDDPVNDRVLPKSHGCSKTFPGRNALADLPAVRHWVRQLALELDQRLETDAEQNGRFARLLVASVSYHTEPTLASPHGVSKSCPIAYGVDRITADAFGLVRRVLSDCQAFYVTSMGLSATNLQATPEKTASITTFLRKVPGKQSAASDGGAPTGSETTDRGEGETALDEEGNGGLRGQVAADEKEGTAQIEGERGGGSGEYAETSTGGEARRKTEVGARKVKRQRSPLRDWLAAASGPRPASKVISTGGSEGKGKGLEREVLAGTATQSDALKAEGRAASEPAECGRTGADDPALQSEELRGDEIDGQHALEGVSCVERGPDSTVGEECEDVQLTLEEWIGDRGGTDSRSAAADPEHASCEGRGRTSENEKGAASSAEVAGVTAEPTGLSDLAKSGHADRLDLGGELGEGNVAIEDRNNGEEKADSGFEWKGALAETATARQVRNRVEAPKSLEALWQKAAVPKTDVQSERTVEDQAGASREGRRSTQSKTRKRSLDGHVADAKEKLQKLWSKAPSAKDETGPAEVGSGITYEFDWQEVDQSTLDELPLAIQAEIRAAQRLQMQRQQPKAAKKLEKAQHAQSIKPFFQRKSR